MNGTFVIMLCKAKYIQCSSDAATKYLLGPLYYLCKSI